MMYYKIPKGNAIYRERTDLTLPRLTYQYNHDLRWKLTKVPTTFHLFETTQ